MKKILSILGLGLSIIWTASAQTPSATINGVPGPFTFTGSGVSQSGQTFTFSGGGGGVTSFTGDSVLLSNSASTGAVTATLANAGANTVFGNETGSSGAPSYGKVALGTLATQSNDTVVMNATGSTAAPTAVAMPTCTTGADLYNTTTHTWICVSTSGYPTPVTLTASSSSELDFTTCISSSYHDYQFRYELTPSSTSQNIFLQFSTNGGSTYDTTSGHYVWGEYFVGVNASTTLTSSSQQSAIGFLIGGFGATTPSTVSGTLTIYNLSVSTSFKRGSSLFTADNAPTSSSSNVQTAGDVYTQTASVNAVRLIAGSGNIASGYVTCQPLPQ